MHWKWWIEHNHTQKLNNVFLLDAIYVFVLLPADFICFATMYRSFTDQIFFFKSIPVLLIFLQVLFPYNPLNHNFDHTRSKIVQYYNLSVYAINFFVWPFNSFMSNKCILKMHLFQSGFAGTQQNKEKKNLMYYFEAWQTLTKRSKHSTNLNSRMDGGSRHGMNIISRYS